jgi:uroporphyrin-III C-methyltransferase/precorrin-2 dehydrogenase/sirohydrochlorin ferrochelatase
MDYLPVFLDLRARATLVVGGGAVAMRKVELLLKAHALVRVVAPALHPELALYRDAGRIEHQPVEFEPSHFDGIVFAIAATDRPEVNGAVAAAGAARGVFVNVVDDQSASSCIMPAIVDRSPVVVAIGSSGQSPTLVRRVRAQLEALLPEGLGDLARLAGRARERIARALPDLDRRRRFWDRLFDGGIATAVLTGQLASAEAMLEHALAQEVRAVPGAGARGEVYLIGAGPGDPDLLTLRALQLLQRADVVLYDRLVSPAVLERVRRDATRICVGKESGRHRVTQQRIHELMVEHAERGQRVARLKGGDPFIFGRGGEEVDVLVAAGIPLVIVPGISAAQGAAAATRVPLTHRGLAQSLSFVTAMGEAAESLDWTALAAPLQTVVFYMGVAQLPRIVRNLLSRGAPSTRPALIIERATLPEQRTVSGTLLDIAQRAQAAGVQAPALLIVGDVAARAAADRNIAGLMPQETSRG